MAVHKDVTFFACLLVLGYKGCHYYSADGKFICGGESDPRKPNEHSPRECDHKIAYSKYPRSEGPTIIKPTGCTSCCIGYKGCYYYSKKGKLCVKERVMNLGL
ncbi:hypothetical protein H5410_027938 [Solanum commersonii]|uniref:Uncharacterized protein n=1 Tax=Solanum commersonii TaxID=4109 RepID=A0A9J5Z5Z8_SOLCO|nr:hypothetical protein H5410_027938 [Solanum commersonii]